jgi:hypothetical protein
MLKTGVPPSSGAAGPSINAAVMGNRFWLSQATGNAYLFSTGPIRDIDPSARVRRRLPDFRTSVTWNRNQAGWADKHVPIRTKTAVVDSTHGAVTVGGDLGETLTPGPRFIGKGSLAR